ncbi:uncharacterized protein HD556DRAFT_1434138 [Suillus plorans]|uniref:Helitron helicase-like domain-containing protein n=1 Tax=Suillus plorans TaxID=116603 RepID=A0A9P7DD94_9AGAM|nr:uncharacterized protein HD556DRAFT_1434138 [Suillus plorans]KAG1788114.1 hypothetical protein HD556DRAFT_1434138 [Suillus plorans]
MSRRFDGPQDSAELRNLLPPTQDELRDAMCVIFAGHQEKPSRQTVKQMRPILITKSIVKTLIEFLISNNPWYQQSGVSYSQANMDSLFQEDEGDVDTSIPQALQICHLISGCWHHRRCRFERYYYGGGWFYQRGSFGNKDPNFAFVCWNMIQKREWTRSTNAKPSTTQEKKAAKLLRRLHSSARSLKGSAGYKLCRRNEIRSLMKKFSTPALFVTVNPHDLTSSLIPIIHGPGVFGHCKAYYGMVEAQGRGTLHCHFLIWVKGNPSPQGLQWVFRQNV